MLNITQATLFVLYLLFLWVPTKKALLLYQQNRYQMQRYDHSLKDELCYHKEHLENICALFGMYVLLFARKEDLPCLFIMLLLMYQHIHITTTPICLVRETSTITGEACIIREI